MAEEGTLSEEPIILGWQLNTRKLTIALPEKKYKCWHDDLTSYIKSRKISHKDLESLIGRLNHSATACPLMRYFLNRIRKTLEQWNTKNTSKKVVLRRPSYVCWSDACPQGLGGYNFLGNAWCYPIPPEFYSAVNKKNNSLEFVAAIITVWISILKGTAPIKNMLPRFLR